ncbi:MAG: hypothetical protein KDN19_15335 [Verrucomicrobiae bacterium]|nr:hypothetical protein [Verrucomicrobiae bacterium]
MKMHVFAGEENIECSVSASRRPPWKFGVRIAGILAIQFAGYLAIFWWVFRPPIDFWKRTETVSAIVFFASILIIFGVLRAIFHSREQRKKWCLASDMLFLRKANGDELKIPLEEVSGLQY